MPSSKSSNSVVHAGCGGLTLTIKFCGDMFIVQLLSPKKTKPNIGPLNCYWVRSALVFCIASGGRWTKLVLQANQYFNSWIINDRLQSIAENKTSSEEWISEAGYLDQSSSEVFCILVVMVLQFASFYPVLPCFNKIYKRPDLAFDADRKLVLQLQLKLPPVQMYPSSEILLMFLVQHWIGGDPASRQTVCQIFRQQ